MDDNYLTLTANYYKHRTSPTSPPPWIGLGYWERATSVDQGLGVRTDWNLVLSQASMGPAALNGLKSNDGV